MYHKRALLIVGVDTCGVYRLPWLLASAGFDVCFLGSEKHAASRSRFISQHISCEPGPQATAFAARQHLNQCRSHYDLIVLGEEPTLWAVLDLKPLDWVQDWFPVAVNEDSIQL